MTFFFGSDEKEERGESEGEEGGNVGIEGEEG